MKYIVVGGNPIRGYTGTETFTGLSVLLVTNNKDEALKCVKEKYNEHGGLIDCFNTQTGKVCRPRE